MVLKDVRYISDLRLNLLFISKLYEDRRRNNFGKGY